MFFIKINKIIFNKEHNHEILFPKRIKKQQDLERERKEEERERELHAIKLKEQQLLAEKAELERKKLEAELEEKNIVKTFKFETYNKETEVRAFYGWEKYVEEKAAAITQKINNNEFIKENTILYGAAGCGKTSYVENVTKAIATKLEKNVTYYNIKNADLKTKAQNSATAHINQLFEQVHNKANTEPVVIFFDEFDGISTKRESHDEKKEDKINHQNNDVTALLLQKIEAAAGKENILIFAATNHIENMDSALIRQGRFDHRIHIGKPNIKMRTEIIKTIFSNSTKEEEEEEEEEKNLLLQLTSNQTTVDVANTVNQYLKFKLEEKNKIKKEKLIVLFAENTIKAQSSRQNENIDEGKINDWIEKAKKADSIKELIQKEQNNSEIVSIQAIEDQEKFPSLKFDLEGLVSSEKINDSYQEKMLASLSNLKELKGLPSRFNRIDESLNEIKKKQNNLEGKAVIIQESQQKIENRLSELILGTNQFLQEYKEQKKIIKKINDNVIAANILSENIKQNTDLMLSILKELDAKTLTKQIAEELKLLMKNMLEEIQALIQKAFVENLKEILEKINNLQKTVNMMNTFEEIKTCEREIKTLCNKTQQRVLAQAMEDKIFLNIVFMTTEEKERLFIEKTKNINWLLKETEKTEIKNFILLITTAYDYNEYAYFLEKMFNGGEGITIQGNAIRKFNEYKKNVTDVCGKFQNLDGIKEAVANKNTSLSIENAPKPTSLTEVWNNLLNPSNYYDQDNIKTNLISLKNIILKKFNTTKDFDDFNQFILACIYLSNHEEAEIPQEYNMFVSMKDNLKTRDSDKIKKIISDVSVYQLKNQIGYEKSYYNNKAEDRLRHRIKFNMNWFLDNIKK